MTYIEFFGFYSQDELDSFGKETSSKPVAIPWVAPLPASFINTDFHAMHFSNEFASPMKKDAFQRFTEQSSYYQEEVSSQENQDSKFGFSDEKTSLSPSTSEDMFGDNLSALDDDSPAQVNPCTGLPEVGNSGIDAGGNVMYSCTDDDSFSFSDDDSASCFDDSIDTSWFD